MSETDKKQFSKSIIMAGLLFLAIFPLTLVGGTPNFVLPTTTRGCPKSTNPYSDVQCNTVTVNIPACPAPNCNAQFATVNIGFNPTFSSVPRVTVQANGNELGIDERSWTVLTTGNAAATWVQPAAVTELFGTTRNRWVMFWQSDDNLTCSLIADVINPGVAGSVLRVQVSPDQSTWSNLQSSPNGDVPIDTAGIFANNYAQAGNGGLGTLLSNTGPYYRVVGQGGNLVNTVSFGNIYFECWWNTVFLQGNAQQITTTGFVLGAMILMPSSNNPQPVDVTWVACTVGC